MWMAIWALKGYLFKEVTMKDEQIEISPVEIVPDEVKTQDHKLLVAIVKKGYAYEVIKTATNSGGKGAIILSGRGNSTTKKRFFGMDIAPEKEMVVMVVKEELAYPIIKEIYAIANFKSDAKGTIMALPISFLLD